METREMICIGCPLGCPLTVSINTSEEGIRKTEITEEDIAVTGNTCKNGEIYAKKEVLHPERMITSTVPAENGICPQVPVKTKTTVPKEMIFAVMDEIHRAAVKAPVKIGDVIIPDVCGTGVDIVAAGNCENKTLSKRTEF